MLISDIDKMDSIISNSSNLIWDGWDVVHIVRDSNAEYHSDGYYDRYSNTWNKRSVYSCGANGWEIPDAVLV